MSPARNANSALQTPQAGFAGSFNFVPICRFVGSLILFSATIFVTIFAAADLSPVPR